MARRRSGPWPSALAIVQAGSAICEERHTFDGFRQEFDRRRSILFKDAEATGTRREEQSVYDVATLASRRCTSSPAAADGLSHGCCCSR